MNGKHTIFDTRRQGTEDSRNISPSPDRPDESNLSSAFLAERGEKYPVARSKMFEGFLPLTSGRESAACLLEMPSA